MWKSHVIARHISVESNGTDFMISATPQKKPILVSPNGSTRISDSLNVQFVDIKSPWNEWFGHSNDTRITSKMINPFRIYSTPMQT